MVTTRAFSRILGFFFRLLGKQGYPKYKRSISVRAHHGRFQRYQSLAHRPDLLSEQTLVFSVEGALLKSPSLFPYFMLVAFEAGSLFRALVLLVLYPFISLVSEEMGLKIMVMVCFMGIKKDSFGVGRAVLPKFFLEDVGFEGFEMLNRGKRVVAVSDMPRVMIESFLKDYLNIEHFVGRELKVFHGYFVGLMEENKKDVLKNFEKKFGEQQLAACDLIGITSVSKCSDDHHDQMFSHCKEIYLTSKAERKRWQQLPREKYPKPFIFHDGRLALRPTPLDTLVMFMWIPIGLSLALIRSLIGISLPYNMSLPLLAFSGLQLRSSKPNTNLKNYPLYVCNHRTLLDPLYLCFALKKNLIAVTYSLSRISEILAPIKTVRLTRDRDQDARKMEKLLSQGGLVVCPEGTTCREPYLLRFSPLFAELSDEIVPVAIDTHATMFYGTTASGLKCLDPLFFLMNPFPSYTVKFLDKVSGSTATCHDGGEYSRFQVANHVQTELAKALGFECTKLTRKDKYLILAGNDGIA